MLKALLIFLGFLCLGESVTLALHLPVAGPVIGMILLLAALILIPGLQAIVEDTASTLVSHFSLLLVPVGVGISVFADKLRPEMAAICVALIVSTLLAVAVTALVTQALMGVIVHGREPEPPVERSE